MSLLQSTVRAVCVILPLLIYVISARSVMPLQPVTPPNHSYNIKRVPMVSLPKDHICRTLFSGVPGYAVPYPKLLQEGVDATNVFNVFQTAMTEFDSYNFVFQKGNFCSDKIYTLLCFYFFPIYVSPSSPPILPCNDVCEEVTKAGSNCTQALLEGQMQHLGTEFKQSEDRGWQSLGICNSTYPARPGTTLPIFSHGNVCIRETHQKTLPQNTLKVTKSLGACAEIGKSYPPYSS